MKDSLRQHIDSIPRVESHYTRAQTSREYIPGDKSLADLHHDYVKQREDMGQLAANLMMYSRIFISEYISFFTKEGLAKFIRIIQKCTRR